MNYTREDLVRQINHYINKPVEEYISDDADFIEVEYICESPQEVKGILITLDY